VGLARLLECVGELDQRRLAPGAAGAGANPIAIDQVDLPRRPGCRRHQSVEPLRVHDHVEPLRSGETAALLLRFEVFRLGEPALRLRALELLLAEERQVGYGVALIEGDDVRERMHRRTRRQRGEVGVDAGLELVLEHDEFRFGELRAIVGDLHRIDDDGAATAQGVDRQLSSGF